MSVFVDIVQYLKTEIYTHLVTAFDLLPPLVISMPFGTGTITLSQLLALIITLFVIFYVTVFPILVLYRSFKRLGGIL